MPELAELSDHAKRARQRIYDQAIALFERKGFAGTTMNDIAQACDVTKPTLYYYFRNKSHLLEVLYEDITADFFTHTRQIALSDAAADVRLTQLVTDLTRYNIGHRRFLRIFWRERGELDGTARAALAELEREYETIVQGMVIQGMRAGQFRPCDPQIATFAILGLLSTVQNWAVFTAAAPDTIADEVAALVLGGLRAA
jgi:AcrR family transcriptional regulator